MLHKHEVQTQLKKRFKHPISSTQYIHFQKENRDYPSYTRLKGLYGSWDELCLSVWGIGAKIRKWSQKEAQEAIVAVFPTAMSSTVYQQERLKGYNHLPTYSVLNELFGGWPEISEAIWGVRKELPKTWDSLDEMKQLLLSYFPEPINSSAYAKQRKEQNLPLPGVDLLYQRLGSWAEVRDWLWGIPKVEWDAESIKTLILSRYPERISSQTYDADQKQDPELPIRGTIVRFYGSWQAFSEQLWGAVTEPTKEEMIQHIQTLFPKRPSQKEYESLLETHQHLMSVYQLERRFGSWNTVMAIAYEGESFQVKVPARKNNRYSNERLIQIVRSYFSERPSLETYQDVSAKRRLLPSTNTLVKRFGSWTEAMDVCFPQSNVLDRRHRWTLDSIQTVLKQACLELDAVTIVNYRAWRLKQQGFTPTVETVARYFGSFYAALESIGYSTPSTVRRSRVRAKTLDSLSHWMMTYLGQLETHPTVESYLVFQANNPSAPSLEHLIRCYGNCWKDVVETFSTEWKVKTFQAYRDDDLKQSLWLAYETIGTPMTRLRYEQFRADYHLKLPSAQAISRRFKSWKEAVELVGIPYYHYTDGRQYVALQEVDYTEEAGLKTLQDVLSWALDCGA